MRVFDWEKAARILKDSKVKQAEAGLIEDWCETVGTILKDGKPVTESNAFLASRWATPVLAIGDTLIDCYRMEGDAPGWGAETLWPKEARDIFAA